jgi:hypothetical protein
LLSLIGLAIGQVQPETSDLEAWAMYAWLAVTSALGAWGVLVASKTWEHRLGDFWLRRLTLAGIGVALGIASFGLASFLGVGLIESNETTAARASGAASVFSHLLYPALVFALPNWAALADPLRKTRLSLYQVGICLLCTMFSALLMHMNATWQSVLVAIIAVSIQLAAPWIAPAQREQLVRERGFE